ncbi:WD40-repeat-containing domain protein [Halenospora varia]|nr:WD40-repeat-containing domain protein [Halenospora varia]
MSRVFKMDEWAPAHSSRVSTSDFSSATGSDDVFDVKSSMPSRFRNRHGSLPFGRDVAGRDLGMPIDFEKLSLGQRPKMEEPKKEGGFRGFIRRASVSIKRRQRRHSHTVHAIEEERPQTAWHRLRQAASFNRHSRCFPPQCFEAEVSSDSTEDFLSPIPGYNGAPPIIPRGSGGEAARATAAAQNEFLFGRHRQFNQLEDRESGIGIALTNADTTMQSVQDPSISCKDFIGELPTELAIQILECLDHHALSRAALVSKRWHLLSDSPHVWREAFIREKSKTYAMSGPLPLGVGQGLPPFSPDHDWKDLYRIRQELERNWLEGAAEPIYLNGHTDSIYCVQFDESKIITGSRDKTIRVWDMKTYTCTLVIGPPDVVGNSAIMTAEDGRSQHYATMPDLSRHAQSIPRAISYPIHHRQSILCLQYDKQILVTGSSDGTCIVYDIQNDYKPMMRLEHHTAAVLDLAFDERYIVTCSKDVSICVWDRHTGAMLKQLRGHAGPVNAVQMRGNTIVSCSGDFKVKLWNIDTGKNIREFSGHTKGLACSQFSDDSKYIASAGNDKIIRIWDANTGECLHSLAAHDNLVRSLHIDSVSGRLISGSYDHDIKVFDMESGRLLLDFPKWHSSWVLGAKSDYRRIISTGQDPKILIMDFGLTIRGIEKLESVR